MTSEQLEEMFEGDFANNLCSKNMLQLVSLLLELKILFCSLFIPMDPYFIMFEKPLMCIVLCKCTL